MSIRDEIANRCAEKPARLHLLQPALDSTQRFRTLFLSQDVHALIMGPWRGASVERRAGRLRADFDMFTDGSLISVAEHPYRKGKSAYLAPTDPKRDSMFDIRSRDPKPGIRVLSAFAEKDTLVALT